MIDTRQVFEHVVEHDDVKLGVFRQIVWEEPLPYIRAAPGSDRVHGRVGLDSDRLEAHLGRCLEEPTVGAAHVEQRPLPHAAGRP